jgi:5-methylcytosine-specific restriction endonuclease McrA
MARFNPGNCMYCGRPFSKPQPTQRTPKRLNPTLEHLYPQSFPLPPGLTDWNDPKNRFRACYECNHEKGNTHPLKWLTLMANATCAIEVSKIMLRLGEDAYRVGYAMGVRGKANG